MNSSVDNASQEAKIQLKIQQGIRLKEDDIVKAIEAALDNCRYPRSGRDKLEHSQFRNLVRVADTTESAEVIKNFLRYQTGRDEKWGRGEGSLAERIIQDIDGALQEMSQEIAKAAGSDSPKAVWVELIRRYLGYGARYLRCLNPTPTRND
jgi:hypothetical protein